MDDRRHYFRRWVELEVLDAVQCGAIYTTTKREGCVLFRYASGKALREHIDGFDTLMAEAVGPHLARFQEFDRAMMTARPPSGSWDIYIPLMGVAPEQQRQGFAQQHGRGKEHPAGRHLHESPDELPRRDEHRDQAQRRERIERERYLMHARCSGARAGRP